MTGEHASGQTNPFSSRFIRPGAIPFLFAQGESATTLVERLARGGWRGEIVGPHGSGKSTLLESLSTALVAADREVVRIDVRDGIQPTLPDTLGPTSVAIVDGYEQLSWLNRARLHWRCSRTHAGLVVTAHASVGLPRLYDTSVELATANAVVDRLMQGQQPTIAAGDVESALRKHDGNLRETLFALYELYEMRRSSGASSS